MVPGLLGCHAWACGIGSLGGKSLVCWMFVLNGVSVRRVVEGGSVSSMVLRGLAGGV